MPDLVPVKPAASLPVAARVALGDDGHRIEELFLFARDAELRVQRLRMDIEERSVTARGEEVVRHEVLLRHPDLARVTTRKSDDPMSRDYEVWIGDGDTIRTYDARHRLASVRTRQLRVSGAGRADLPAFARTRTPRTHLPAGSIADAFVHPHGLFRNVLVTGPLTIVGTRPVAGREAIVVRTEHPRSVEVLVDRPDHWMEVGIDRASGFVLTLTERVAGVVTQHAEVQELQLDPDIPDSAFELHLGSDVRMLY